MERSGNEWRWKRHSSVTFRGNSWYRHSQQAGSHAIDFMQEFFDDISRGSHLPVRWRDRTGYPWRQPENTSQGGIWQHKAAERKGTKSEGYKKIQEGTANPVQPVNTDMSKADKNNMNQKMLQETEVPDKKKFPVPPEKTTP